MNLIRIEFGPRELSHSTAYDALAGDLHEQGWKMVTIEPSEDAEGYSVAVYLSRDVADGVLDTIRRCDHRAARPCPGTVG